MDTAVPPSGNVTLHWTVVPSYASGTLLKVSRPESDVLLKKIVVEFPTSDPFTIHWKLVIPLIIAWQINAVVSPTCTVRGLTGSIAAVTHIHTGQDMNMMVTIGIMMAS